MDNNIIPQAPLRRHYSDGASNNVDVGVGESRFCSNRSYSESSAEIKRKIVAMCINCSKSYYTRKTEDTPFHKFCGKDCYTSYYWFKGKPSYNGEDDHIQNEKLSRKINFLSSEDSACEYKNISGLSDPIVIGSDMKSLRVPTSPGVRRKTHHSFDLDTRDDFEPVYVEAMPAHVNSPVPGKHRKSAVENARASQGFQLKKVTSWLSDMF